MYRVWLSTFHSYGVSAPGVALTTNIQPLRGCPKTQVCRTSKVSETESIASRRE
jgi:hypothetical protein